MLIKQGARSEEKHRMLPRHVSNASRTTLSSMHHPQIFVFRRLELGRGVQSRCHG